MRQQTLAAAWMRTTNHIVGVMSHLRHTLCWHYGCLLISFVHIIIIELLLKIFLIYEYSAHTVAGPYDEVYLVLLVPSSGRAKCM